MTSLYKQLSYTQDIDTVNGIQFRIMGPGEIRDRSAVKVLTGETYDGLEVKENGLFDPRMGVIDHNKQCVTCKQTTDMCPGHFGHIELAKPVFYPQFFPIVKNLLKCVCFKCSKLLIDPESPELKNVTTKKNMRQKRWEAIYKQCQKTRRCGQVTLDGCGAKQPTISKEGLMKISFEWRESVNADGEIKKQVLNAEDVLKILRRISKRDAEALGFPSEIHRPEYLICSVFPVSPPSMRPSVRNETGVRSEDDITHKLSMTVKANNGLQARIDKGGDPKQIDPYWSVLQWELATLIDNTLPGIPQAQQRTGRPIRSLTERLKAKDGRIRGNLMGKRVDYSARSVITPDPWISIDELGVPIKIAMNLTMPEVVNKYNKAKLIELVRNGPDKYPGAKYIKQGERTLRLRAVDRTKIELQMGDVVSRHLRNGDYVLFNRQPSLHKMSMMGHRVRVMPFDTFRLNVMVTPSYNADFDGDKQLN